MYVCLCIDLRGYLSEDLYVYSHWNVYCPVLCVPGRESLQILSTHSIWCSTILINNTHNIFYFFYLWVLYCTILSVLTEFEEIREHTHNQTWQLPPLIHDVYCPVLCVFVFYDHGEATMSRLPSCPVYPLFWKRALWLRSLLHHMYCPVLRVFVYYEHEVAAMYRLPSVLQNSPMT